ncbi:hypothetical protein RRG08_007002 [Elysia crispata]|uniref:Uncharacterized protein n=1 Tax=Elysia crispata TaxID=231223 RepID=A0AAE1EED5_9GAST|nr:hypothetical protein RRG08_007002 [Elysia crispata]
MESHRLTGFRRCSGATHCLSSSTPSQQSSTPRQPEWRLIKSKQHNQRDFSRHRKQKDGENEKEAWP